MGYLATKAIWDSIKICGSYLDVCLVSPEADLIKNEISFPFISKCTCLFDLNLQSSRPESDEKIHVGLGRPFGILAEEIFDHLPDLFEAGGVVDAHVEGVAESESGRKVLSKALEATDCLLGCEMVVQQIEQV